MTQKRHLISSEQPIDYDTNALLYPRDRFELVSVDAVQTFEQPYKKQISGTGKLGVYVHRRQKVLVTLKCRRCGSIKRVVDKRDVSCKEGPCHCCWKDLTGRLFGKLTALEYVHVPYKQGAPAKWYWRCRCSCGNECLKSAHDLLNTGVQECPGCSISTKRFKVTLPENGAAWNNAYTAARKGAQVRDLVFDLTMEQFQELCKQPCYYCGAAPALPMYSGRLRTMPVCYRNGVDRYDNSQGYTVDNCVPCCSMCNRMKTDIPYDTWLAHLKQIIQRCDERSTTIPEGSTPKQVETDSGSTKNRRAKT